MYIEIKDLYKHYGKGESLVSVLNGVNTSIDKGIMCVIQGSSGSGKSTLLNMIGGLDTIDSGEVIVDGIHVDKLSPKELGNYRRTNLGFVFQNYNLIQNLTVRENIELCANLTKSPLDINELIENLGLSGKEDKFPTQLSGGQQQRCAIARALIKNPLLLLCDEPTGALDSKTSKDILQLLEKVNAIYHTTMLIVTHNNAIKNMVDKVIYLKDGVIEKEYMNENKILAADLVDL